MPVRERMEAESRQVQEMKTLLVKKVYGMYSSHKKYELVANSQTRKEMVVTLRKNIAKEVTRIFDLIKVYMAAYRGPTFQQDDLTRNKVVQDILSFISRGPKLSECIDGLKKILRDNPLPKFRMEQTIKKTEDPLNPLHTLKKPPSALVFRRRMMKGPGATSTPTNAKNNKFAQAFKKLKAFQEQREGSSTRVKLEKFTTKFCESKFVNLNLS